jgi:6-phosphogluconolactonase
VKIEVLPDADAVARRGAERIAASSRAAVAERGRFTLALSGGHTPWAMLQKLAREQLPWREIHVLQVDERVAPAGDRDRNWTHVLASLQGAPLGPGQLHPMPVDAPDLASGVHDYERELAYVAGAPAVLDLVHLGLGPDGHTASLVPRDPALEITAREVTVTRPYQGRQRMTLTFPVLDRAREILWLVTGSDKAEMLARLRAGDRTIPAGRVSPERALILADRDAAGALERR